MFTSPDESMSMKQADRTRSGLTKVLVVLALFGLAAVWMLLSAPAASAQVANDDVAFAEILTGYPTVAGTNGDATREFGEDGLPDVCPGDTGTVWYEWTPPSDTSVMITVTSTSALSPAVDLYTATNSSDFATFDLVSCVTAPDSATIDTTVTAGEASSSE